jgi:DNA-binding response OmpR family regulator
MRRDDPALRHRLLIVDDEESTRLLLARLMSQELGADAQLAGTCEQAVRLAAGCSYDAILLDLMMPGIGGLAVLKAIRTGAVNAATPVIIVSILGDAAMIEQCMSAGANAYHVKPVRRKELVAMVKAQLAARRKSKISAN